MGIKGTENRVKVTRVLQIPWPSKSPMTYSLPFIGRNQPPYSQNLMAGKNRPAAHQERQSAAAINATPVVFRCKRPTHTA